MAKRKSDKLRKLTIILVVAAAIIVFFVVTKNPQSSQPIISKKEAITKVKTLPEVKDYLKRVPNAQVLVNGEENNTYMVQVYEYKNGYTATFNWYSVYKKSGEIKKEF